MKIVIVSDAWEPQVNGVVRTLKQTRDHLIKMGHEVLMITPDGFTTIPCPSYPSIRLSLFPSRKVRQILNSFQANAIHIATEGPLGIAARRWCIKNDIGFTTSYHTQFPEYLRLRAPIPLRVSYAWLRHFHSKAVRTLVPTQSQKNRLIAHGFYNVTVWGRGVDSSVFTTNNPVDLKLKRPVLMNMGRVAIEKNIEAFLNLNIDGSKVVIGDGPDLQQLKEKYPQVTFTGAKFGIELAAHLAAADVFVFPSKTDTFGLVLLEAMACGLPIAAYPVTGPLDVVKNGVTGYMNEELSTAVIKALSLSSKGCVDYAQSHSWEACSSVFAANMFDNTKQPKTEDSHIINQSFWCL